MRLSVPLTLQLRCAPDPVVADPERQTKVALNFLANPITDLDETFAMNILSYLLISG